MLAVSPAAAATLDCDHTSSPALASSLRSCASRLPTITLSFISFLFWFWLGGPKLGLHLSGPTHWPLGRLYRIL
ncbi:MAG: hypothetical protein ACRYG7_07885 [Janthinobacterium lividum]